MTIPIPLDDLTLWGILFLQMLPYLVLVIIGLLTADVIADKQKANETKDPNAYDLSWKELILYGIGATLIAMTSLGALLKDLESNILMAATVAWAMGLVFRIILPDIIAIVSAKMKAVIQAIFK